MSFILILHICVWADVCSFVCVKKAWQWMNCGNGWTSPEKCVSAHCAVECKGFSAHCQRSFGTCWTDVTNLRAKSETWCEKEFSRRLGKSDTFFFILVFGLLTLFIEMTVEIKVWNYGGGGGGSWQCRPESNLCLPPFTIYYTTDPTKILDFNFIV